MTRLTLRIDFDEERALGLGKVRPLELVAETGSISAAGRAMGMSYRWAWLLVDALGNPVGFHLSGGQTHDLVGADHLHPGIQAAALTANEAFDADTRVLELLAQAGRAAVIPPKANCRVKRDYHRHLYRGTPPDREPGSAGQRSIDPIDLGLIDLGMMSGEGAGKSTQARRPAVALDAERC